MTNSTLETLNTLRAENGKTPLKSWKESKAKLKAAILNEQTFTAKVGIDQAKKEEQRVARLRQEQLEETARKTREQREAAAAALTEAEAKMPKPTPAKAKGPVDVKALQEALAKTTKTATKIPPAGTKPAKAAKPAKAKSTGTGSSEAGIAAERLGLSGKAVRAKLRKLGHTAGHGLSADQIVKLIKK